MTVSNIPALGSSTRLATSGVMSQTGRSDISPRAAALSMNSRSRSDLWTAQARDGLPFSHGGDATGIDAMHEQLAIASPNPRIGIRQCPDLRV